MRRFFSLAGFASLTNLLAWASACSPSAPPAAPASASPASPAASHSAAPNNADDPNALTPPQGEIKRAVASATPEINRCYDVAKQKNATAQGHVRLRVVIRSNGKVETIEDMDSDFPDRDAIQCVSSAVNRVTFPSFREGYEVGVPFWLKPPDVWPTLKK